MDTEYTRRGLLACVAAITSASSGCLGTFEKTAPRIVGLHATNYYPEDVGFSIKIKTEQRVVYETTTTVQGVGKDGIPSGTDFEGIPEKRKPYEITVSLGNNLQESLKTGEINSGKIRVQIVAGREDISDGLYFGVTSDIPESATEDNSTTR